MVIKHSIAAALLLSVAACSSTQQATHQNHNDAASHPPTESKHSGLAVPQAIKEEHEHLHHQLDAAVRSGGTTRARAREVAAVLMPHFQEEEAYAMPPLGLLEQLAHNQPVDEAQAD